MQKVTEKINCLTCDYSIEQSTGVDLTRLSHCLFNPPTMSAIGAAGGMAQVTAFPQVTGDMICSKWEAQLPELSLAAQSKFRPVT